jgi:hypothetical protein
LSHLDQISQHWSFHHLISLIRVSTVLVFKADQTSHFIVFCAENCSLTLCTGYCKTGGNAVPFHPILILRQSFARLNRCIIQLLWKWSWFKTKSDLRLKKCTKLTVKKFRLDFNNGHDLVQIEKPNGRGTTFPEVTFLNLVANLAPYDKSLVAKWHL